MSFFGVVTQFLNDSSSYLIDAFNGYIQGARVKSKDEEPWDEDINPKVFESKCVQTGCGILPEHQEVSIQCPVSLLKKANRTTSVYQVKCDRYTGTHSFVDKIDTSTNPQQKIVCKKHREVYAALKQWPFSEVTLKSIKDQRPNKLTRLKLRLMSALHIFNPTKIQNLPFEHFDDRGKTLSLYRCASIDDIVLDRVLMVKSIGNRKNKRALQKIK